MRTASNGRRIDAGRRPDIGTADPDPDTGDWYTCSHCGINNVPLGGAVDPDHGGRVCGPCWSTAGEAAA